MEVVEVRRPSRQDTFDLREKMQPDDTNMQQDGIAYASTDDEEHSVLEDDSDGEEREMEYDDEDEDDRSSSLSIPNESIDFDLVYSLHSFAATVEGQANVVKGDSLFLMDDSNSYWWLVRVLKTQEVGYIPAENIETPFERLARLNKHRNVDLASATQAEVEQGRNASRERIRSRPGSTSPILGNGPVDLNGAERNKGVVFQPSLAVHRYLPAVWNEEETEEEDIEWDDEAYEAEDAALADEQLLIQQQLEQQQQKKPETVAAVPLPPTEPDDGMRWDNSAAQSKQAAALVNTQLAREQQMLQEQQALQQKVSPVLRSSNSREAEPSSVIDPANATETRRLVVTPSIARDETNAALRQSTEEERNKRARDAIEAASEDARSSKKSKGKEKMAPPVSSASLQKANSGKLRKENTSGSHSEDEGKKKKSGGVFGSLFRKKDKGGSRGTSIGSLESTDIGRTSEESSRSGHTAAQGTRPSNSNEALASPTTVVAKQQQQYAITRASEDTSNLSINVRGSTPPSTPQPVSQLRQRDQQQQALYQQYLNRSPSSLPEAQPGVNYGLQTASAVMGSGPSSYSGPSASGLTPTSPSTPRQRPGSVILIPSSTAAASNATADLSVIRVFAGHKLQSQTEATFKTVLLNTNTTSRDLVTQALQRFRINDGGDAGNYFLTIKQVEGSSAVLLDDEHPLGVFESLVEEAEAASMPKVKRSSVGSISSVRSNLSMLPAIRKLAMNDFTDDSRVKFYLDRKDGDGHGSDRSVEMNNETLDAVDSSSVDGFSPRREQFLTVSTSGNNVTPERFTSPSYRFGLQLLIYPEDLPEDMVFDTTTEAIVFKNRAGGPSGGVASPGVSQTMRRKVFVFPRNITVAEVIEIGLERFGILEGVVDGGDEIEDKLSKRRSAVSARVRYSLCVADSNGGQDRELSPSSRVVDAFPADRPPTYRAPQKYADSNAKRRSVDSAQLLGSFEDIGRDDPLFILRRSVSYRNTSNSHSRKRMSAPLDEIALQKLHRESAASASSTNSNSNSNSDGTAGAAAVTPSRQEIIAAQRAASRANQRAILSAQTNSVRGVDVLLPGNAMIRSARTDSTDLMRYSYVQPDGESYDISDIVEEEWLGEGTRAQKDLLENVLVKNRGDGPAIGEKLERVLSKINKSGKMTSSAMATGGSSLRTASPSEYSFQDGSRSRSVTPSAGAAKRTSSPMASLERAPSATAKPPNKRQPSIASVMSDISGYDTSLETQESMRTSPDSNESHRTPTPRNQQKYQRKGPYIPKDDFGIPDMMAVIEYNASLMKSSSAKKSAVLDPVDELLFGKRIEFDSLHPSVKEIYEGAFMDLADMDRALDDFLTYRLQSAR